MANSILGSGIPSNNNSNSPMQMLQQFNQFRQQMSGQNPRQMIQQLMQSGQMSQAQFNQLRQQAEGMLNMFRR